MAAALCTACIDSQSSMHIQASREIPVATTHRLHLHVPHRHCHRLSGERGRRTAPRRKERADGDPGHSRASPQGSEHQSPALWHLTHPSWRQGEQDLNTGLSFPGQTAQPALLPEQPRCSPKAHNGSLVATACFRH